MAPPACIFIVRHGNRLDAADKQWHTSSPTPYDPPLTYSGWTQSRTVGVNIGEILRERAAKASNTDAPGKKKRYRIVIHTSPYLRCIQTSIAISSGLSSTPSLLAVARRNLSASQIAALPDDRHDKEESARSTLKSRRTSCVGRKIVLRVDAFLGEWLSPGYFELITPPPGSMMMLASAKASLLKPEDYSKYPHFQPRAHSNSTAQPPTGHLWGGGSALKPSPSAAAVAVVDEDPAGASTLDSLDDLASSLPTSNRRDSIVSEASEASYVGPTREAGSAEIGAYDPPVPTFSLSKHAPIPPGFVNHAKDHCVIVDYQWDSMRAPYDWGDGGELPEDWPDMHKRFRKGLQALVDWYTTTEDPTSAVTSEYIKPGTDGREGRALDADEDEDDQEETVVIIVSHGAGCNAMIGAITYRPVLMDVPISSLTMATLNKPVGAGPATNGAGAPSGHRGSTPVHQSHSVVMFASTDHLRSGTPTSSSSRSSSMTNAMGHRGRNSNSFSSPLSGGSLNADSHISRSSSANNASSTRSLGSIRRSLMNSAASRAPGPGISVATGQNSSFTPSGLSRTPSIGLWSPATAKRDPVDEECIEDEEDTKAIPGGFGRPPERDEADGGGVGTSSGGLASKNAGGQSTRPTAKSLGGQQGGSSPLPLATAGGESGANTFLRLTQPDVIREAGSKRRWSVTERP